MCPEDLPQERMTACHALTPELFRQVFRFLLGRRIPDGKGIGEKCVTTDELLGFAHRMLKLFTGLGLESSKTHMMVTIILLMLEAGDYVAADHLFTDFLSDNDFLRCTDSRLAEDFVMAFRNLDLDALDRAQRSSDLTHLEREVQLLAKSLNLLSGDIPENEFEEEPIVQVPIVSAPGKTEAQKPSYDSSTKETVKSAPAAVASPSVELAEDDLDALLDVDLVEEPPTNTEEISPMPPVDDYRISPVASNIEDTDTSQSPAIPAPVEEEEDEFGLS